MFIAQNQKKQPVHANEAKSESGYVCPGCKSKVILKKGQLKLAHFAHVKKEACHSFSEGETEEHLTGKLDLYHWLKKEGLEVELESYIDELDQRPDLLIRTKNTTIAIEFQCSPISVDKIVERTKGYLSKDINVIWIVGQKIKLSKRLTATQKAYLYPLKDTYVLFHYDYKIKRLIADYNFQSSLKSMTYKRINFPLFSTFESIKEALYKKSERQMATKTDKEQMKNNLLRMSYYQNEQAREFFSLLYQNRESIQTIPFALYHTIADEWMIQSFSYEWKYSLILWFQKQPNYKVFTQKSVRRLVNDSVREKKLIYHPLPNVPSDYIYKPIFQFIRHITHEQLLEEVGRNKWKIKRNKGQ